MRRVSFRLVLFVTFVFLALFLFEGLFTQVNSQVPPVKKILPKQKTIPGQKVEPKVEATRQFKIGEFTVIVDSDQTPGEAVTATAAARDKNAQPAAKTGAALSGQGHIVIKGQKVPVTCANIVVTPGKQGEPPVATSGTVKGNQGAAVEYNLDGYRIKLERQSILITPNSATAAAGLSLAQAPFMTADQGSALTLASESCGLAPDGTIWGQNFRGAASLLLRDSIYRLRTEATVDQSVRLGKQDPGSRTAKPRQDGVLFTGIASTLDGIDVFMFKGAIDRNGKAAQFDLALIRNPYQTEPEPGYALTLQSGGVRYSYDQNGALACEGEFTAGLTLPEATKNENSGRIVLENVVLKTDQTGALFNALTISARIRAGFADVNLPGRAVFLIEPSPSSVFVFFARWQAPRNSTYTVAMTDQKKGPDCQALVDFLGRVDAAGATTQPAVPRDKVQRKMISQRPNLKAVSRASQSVVFGPNDKARERNVYGRPGLTILQGTLYMKAPQASFPGDGAPPSGEFDLKTRFWGLLTATPWGVTGNLTSSACSFIPASPGHSLDECSVSSGTSQPTWQEILEAQERNPSGQPQHKQGRFLLADLRILDMRVDRLSLCMNALPANGATVISIVHFPFPSYIDIDFIDQSLDSEGRFHKALGPIAPMAVSGSAPASPSPNDPWPDPRASLAMPHGPNIAASEMAAGQIGPTARVLRPLLKAKQTKEIPQTRILWAWRLPITLTGRSVTISYPQGQGPAGVQVVMNSTPDDSGKITSSEIWLKPLFSKNSAVKAGVRFQAGLTTKGDFQLTGWDTEPVLCRTYPSPGRELLMGFPCRLDRITLADAGPTFNAELRTSDFNWTGIMTFPFFKDRAVAFGIKKLEPFMPQSLNIETTSGACYSCSTSGDTPREPDSSRNLTLRVDDLRFSPTGVPFVSSKGFYRDPLSSGDAVSIEFSSFLSAQVRKSAGSHEVPYPLTDKIVQGETDTEHVLKDWVEGKNFIDLVCYDKAALDARIAVGMPSACCKDNYVMGTYEVKKAGKVILSASRVKYYPSSTPFALVFNSSSMQLTPEGDGGAGGNRMSLDIPGAQITIENGTFYGDFDTDSLPAFLPNVRGECAFYLDPKGGYFALMIAGSFPITPFPINVEGETFFFHAPLGSLRAAILDRARYWALYPSTESIQIAVGMSGLSDSTIMSGALLSGNAAAVVDLGPIEAKIQRGAGLFFYRYEVANGAAGYNYGVFQNNRGRVDLEFLSAEIIVDMTAAAGSDHSSFESVKSYFRNTDLAFTGTIKAEACATCKLMYASVSLELTARYSVRTGFSFQGTPKASVGLGGC